MKTRKAVASRFRVTATGKLKMGRPGKRHLLAGKTAKRKRQLRRPNLLDQTKEKVYRRLMCV